MGYIGPAPTSGFISNAKERYTGITTAYVDLNHSISSLADVIVWVNYVKQDATNLTLTSSTRITLGATLVSADIVEVAYLGKAVSTQAPATGQVTNDMLSGSIANSKLANSSITLNGSAVSLGGSATVTPSVTPDNLQYFSTSANQTISANTMTTITNYGDGQITGRLLYNYGTQYVTHSSGTFSFSTEGYYHVTTRISGSVTGATSGNAYLHSTTDNSSYADAIDVNFSKTASGGFNYYFDGIFKITDTTNHKLQNRIYLPTNGGEVGGHGGNNTRQRTFMRFARLGTTA